MKVLLQKLVAWWTSLQTITLLMLSFNIPLSSKDGMLGKDPGLFVRVLF